MSRGKMLILRGNSADAGTYPDEQGNTNVAWPFGALHVWAAREYARRKDYEPVVLDIPGQPQSETSPQATEALKQFLEDQSVRAFYGFFRRRNQLEAHSPLVGEEPPGNP